MNVLTSVAFHTQEENGHSSPQNNKSEGPLARWCKKQRVAHANNMLGEREIELLEQVNFRFESQMRNKEVRMWNKQYQGLVAFYVSIFFGRMLTKT